MDPNWTVVYFVKYDLKDHKYIGYFSSVLAFSSRCWLGNCGKFFFHPYFSIQTPYGLVSEVQVHMLFMPTFGKADVYFE